MTTDMESPTAILLDAAALQAKTDRSPFNRWMGLRVTAVREDGVEIRVPWREEFIGSPQLGRVHGGLIASLVDVAGGYAVMSRTGKSSSTVDMRVDYHRPAGVGELQLFGTIAYLGRQLSCADVRVCDASGVLLASGRGTYYTPSSKPSAEAGPAGPKLPARS